MAVVLVKYELKHPGKNYEPLYEYLRRFTGCQGLDSAWLLDTHVSPRSIRDTVKNLVDADDVVFVVQLANDWAAYNNHRCGDWLSKPQRSW